MKKKIEAILKTKPKKPEKFLDIKTWWIKRNGLLHFVDRMSTTSADEINNIATDLEKWTEI